MNAFALWPEQDEQPDGAPVGGSEPVRQRGVELRGLSWRQDEILLAQHQPQASVEHVKPFVPTVGLWSGFGRFLTGRDEHLVCLYSAGPAGKRDEGHVMTADRTEMDPRVTRTRGAD